MAQPIDSSILFRLGARIDGLPTAIADGQPITYEQLLGMVEPQRLDRLIAFTLPGSGTALTSFGTTASNGTTISHPTPTTTNLLASLRRALLTTAATAAAITYHRQGNTLTTRGNAANVGGFRFSMTVGLESLVAGMRSFFGLTDSVANPTNIDPLTATAPGCIGLGINTNTGNWNIVSHASGSAPVVVALPATVPVNTTDPIEFKLNCAPNSLLIDYKVTNLATGAVQIGTIAAANLPTNTTYLAPTLWITNNATAAATAMSLVDWKLEKYTSPVQFPVAGLAKRLGCKLRFPATPSPSVASIFPAGSFLQAIPWQVADYNDGGMFSFATNLVTIPEDGLWSCSGNLFFTGIGRRIVSLFVNNQEFRLQDFTATSGSDQLLAGGIPSIRLNKNDLVSIGGFANAVSGLLTTTPAPLGANYAIFERLN
jgi:hypothetical protein